MNIKLRTFELEDAATVADLVGDEAVSKWTSNIPHPYSEQDAVEWIEQTKADASRNPYAVLLNDRLVACVSYWPHMPDGIEVGYWVGKPFWGKGICTKALMMLLANEDFPTTENIFAKVMEKNIASQRVLQKCGFSFLRNGTIPRRGHELSAKYFVRYSPT